MPSATEAFDLGVEYVRSNELQLALEAFTNAITSEPGLAVAYHGRGIIHAIRGDLDAALSDFDQAIRLRPEAPKFYHARALVRGEIGQAAEAEADLQRYRQLSGDGNEG